MTLPLDYECLRLIWWGLLGLLLIGFTIMDGFDMGVATLLPFVARTDTERRLVINTIGPVWEGNQVWLVLGGGAIFAAWPYVYAVAFSGFYLALMIILMALILRPVGFKYRSKIEQPYWRQAWDICLFIGGAIPSLIFGVAVGNVIQGVPFSFDETLNPTYTGSFLELLNPFALVCGLISLIMMTRHGALYLGIKLDGPVSKRIRELFPWLSWALILLLTAAWWWVERKVPTYHVLSPLLGDGPSNPLLKHVAKTPETWMRNFILYPWMLTAPALAYGGIIASSLAFWWKRPALAFLFNSFSLFGIISIVGLGLYPLLLPSSTHPSHSLTIWDASSSHLTLFIMLVAVLIFMPLVLIYTTWVYHVLRGKVTEADIQAKSPEMY